MEHLLTLFQQHNCELFLTGAAARHFLCEGTWGEPFCVEWIALAPRSAVLSFAGTALEEPAPRGPLKGTVLIEGVPRPALVFCVPPRGNPQARLKGALARRAFAVDALALDARGELFDPFAGWAELQEGKISTIQSRPSRALREDPLRILGLSRLVAESGLTPVPALLRAASREAAWILYVPRQGWLREMTRLLCGPYATKGLQTLYQTRLLGLLLPEVHSLVGLDRSSPHHHKDLWEHTKQVVGQCTRQPLVRWAALLHDVGKVWTRTFGPRGEVHFFQHEELGAILAEGVCARMGMEQDFARQLQFLIRFHLRPNAYESSWTDSAVRRLMTEAGELLEPLLALSQADLTSAHERRRRQSAQRAQELAQRIETIRQQDKKRSPFPKGLGRELISYFGLEEGPLIGQLMRFLQQAIDSDDLLAEQSSHYYLDFLSLFSSLPLLAGQKPLKKSPLASLGPKHLAPCTAQNVSPDCAGPKHPPPCAAQNVSSGKEPS